MAALPSRFDRSIDVSLQAQETVSQLKIAMFESTVLEPSRTASRGLPKPPTSFRRLEPTPELLEELRAASQGLETATPEEIIAWGVERYAPYLTMATAFGPEGCVILAMLAKIAPETYVFNLETGYQFPETLELRERIAEKYGIEVDLLQPDTTEEDYEALDGGPLYRTNPNKCCADRKERRPERASNVMHDWMSRIHRDHSTDRAHAAIVGRDKRFGLVKISPLANWTKKDVWKRITSESIPYNPLHDQGYPSIGCWPCTRAVAAGETDDRAGRWSGMKKTECGLHSINEQDGSGI